MANEKKAYLTKEQRAALKPMFEKFAKAYDELEEAVAAAVPHHDPDLELGVCFRCEMREEGPVCSSFLGTGRLCQREFCKHSRMSHT
jgi:hypothetical protein